MGLETDVFIAGGGPAGLAAAIAARKKGFRVIVADGAKPPLDKACGEGLMPDALTALQELGVSIHADEGYAFSGIRFLDRSSKVDANFPLGTGIGARRTLLHQKMLTQAEACGVSFLWNAPITGLARDGVNVRGERIAARWIIGADGTRSRIRRWSGLDAHRHFACRFAYRRHYAVQPWSEYVEVYWGEAAQAYLTPVGEREVCAVVMSRDPHARLETLWGEYPELARRLEKAEQTSVERGAVTAMHRLEQVWRHHVALIGDASGGVDAITGEGLCLSFQQAAALANALEAGDLGLYQQQHRLLLRRPTITGQLMLLLDARPALRLRIIGVLAANPGIFQRLLTIHAGAASPAQIAAAGARLGWQWLLA